MPGTGFRAIPFKKDIANAARFGRNASEYVLTLAAEAQREFSADYGRVPESPTYRRTGTLGRGWRGPLSIRLGRDYSVTVTNPVQYAVYVQGPSSSPLGGLSGQTERQSRAMRRRGWRSTDEVLRTVEKRINQRFRKRLFVT